MLQGIKDYLKAKTDEVIDRLKSKGNEPAENPASTEKAYAPPPIFLDESDFQTSPPSSATSEQALPQKATSSPITVAFQGRQPPQGHYQLEDPWLKPGRGCIKKSVPENFWTEIVYYPYPVSSTEYEQSPALRACIKQYAKERRKRLKEERQSMRLKK